MKFFAGVVVTVLVGLAIGGFIFATGRYVAANAPPDFTDKLAPWVLEEAITRRAKEVTDPVSKDPNAVALSLSHYRENCLPCTAPRRGRGRVPGGHEPHAPGDRCLARAASIRRRAVLGHQERHTHDGHAWFRRQPQGRGDPPHRRVRAPRPAAH